MGIKNKYFFNLALPPTVIYSGEEDAEVMDMCNNLGYKYIYRGKMTGAEDQVVILLNTLVGPEQITRGINMLIIVNNGR